MEVVPFKADHLLSMTVQPSQRGMWASLTLDDLRTLEGAWTITIKDGAKVYAVGGVAEMWAGVGFAWSYIAEDAGPYMAFITRSARRVLKLAPYHRLEMLVDADFEPGRRWAKMLGFEVETPLKRKAMPDGADAVGYVRFK